MPQGAVLAAERRPGVVVAGARMARMERRCRVAATVVGFTLIHAYAARTRKGLGWLTLMYVLWIVLDP